MRIEQIGSRSERLPRAQRLRRRLLAALSLAFLACTQNLQYRSAQDAVEPVASSGPPAWFGVIEFDDHGFYWDRAQLTRVVETIRSATREGAARNREALVFVFVHGWNHNAEPADRNLVSARALVGALARAEEDSEIGDHRPVVGIYLAWRGKRVNPPWLRFTSYWNRNAGAVRVGTSLALGDALREILDATKSQSAGGNPNSRVVAVGHSMGSVVLQEAMAGLLPNATVAGDRDDGSGIDVSGRRSPSFPDLVVLLNSAASSLQALQIVEHLESHGVRRLVTRKQELYRGPLLVSLTSESDRATSALFRFGKALDPYRGGFRREREEPFPHSQRDFYFTSDGHNRELWTHRLVRANRDATVCPNGKRPEGDEIAPALLRNAYRYRRLGTIGEELRGFEIDLACRADSSLAERYRFERIEDARNRSAFWFAHLPREIVDGHGDIFGNPALLQLVVALADLSSVFEPAQSRAAAGAQRTE